MIYNNEVVQNMRFKMANQIQRLTNQLTKKELVNVICAYNDYIVEFYEFHDKSCEPVCFCEFYDCEYQE
jgi:hypothetical protein